MDPYVAHLPLGNGGDARQVLSIDIPAYADRRLYRTDPCRHKSYLFVRFHSVESYERGLALDGAHLDDIRLYIRTSTRTGPQSRRSSRDYPRSPTSAPRYSHARSDTPEEERPFSPNAPELHAWHDHAKVSPSERAMSLEALDYGFDVAQRTGTESLLPEREVAVTSASEEKFRSEGRVERWREETVKSRGDNRHATRRASRSRSRERDGTRGSGRERDRSTTQEDLAYRGKRNSNRRGNSLFDTRHRQSLPPASGSRTLIFQDRDVQASRRRSLSPASIIVDLERDTRGTPAPRIILPLPSSAAAVHDENRPVSSVRDPASSRALSRTQTASSLANIVNLGLQLSGEGVSSSSDAVELNQFICEASRLVVRNLSPLCSPEVGADLADPGQQHC